MVVLIKDKKKISTVICHKKYGFKKCIFLRKNIEIVVESVMNNSKNEFSWEYMQGFDSKWLPFLILSLEKHIIGTNKRKLPPFPNQIIM